MLPYQVPLEMGHSLRPFASETVNFNSSRTAVALAYEEMRTPYAGDKKLAYEGSEMRTNGKKLINE